MKILSIDPGKRVGYAEVEFGGKVLQNGAVDWKDLPDFMEALDWDGLTAIVYESFRVYASHARHFTGSVMEVTQVIGVLSAYGNMHKVQLVQQQPYCFKIGAKYLGAKLPKGHLQDELSALYHAFYYLKSIDQFTTLLEAQRRQ